MANAPSPPPARDIDYGALLRRSLRGLVREVLARTAREGLPGTHHFYIAFSTSHEGVEVPARVRAKHPDEMTIVLQHQFEALEVEPERFRVGLAFGGVPARVTVPFEAVVGFADPAAEFAIRIDRMAVPGRVPETSQRTGGAAAGAVSRATGAEGAAAGTGTGVISLDDFRAARRDGEPGGPGDSA